MYDPRVFSFKFERHCVAWSYFVFFASIGISLRHFCKHSEFFDFFTNSLFFLRRFCGDFRFSCHFCGDFAAISRLKFGKYFQKWKLYFLIRNIEKPFIYGSFSIFSVCDPVGIQTQDLQNRNLTLYSAKLRDQDCVLTAASLGNASAKVQQKSEKMESEK